MDNENYVNIWLVYKNFTNLWLVDLRTHNRYHQESSSIDEAVAALPELSLGNARYENFLKEKYYKIEKLKKNSQFFYFLFFYFLVIQRSVSTESESLSKDSADIKMSQDGSDCLTSNKCLNRYFFFTKTTTSSK